MPKSAMIHARVEPELKSKVESVFSELGLNMTSALNLFFRQVVLQKGLPFSVNIPNETTIKAIEEAREAIKGKASFENADSLFSALDED